ncbi:MAG TPA: sensor histidine kinase, partial [Anaerolineae bacterium]|nr:sensor histidine kinase [Anaerolineae bacterium]
SWEQRFLLASLAILVAGMIGVGAWVSQQIQDGVVQRTAATTALYVDSFIAPNLQSLAQTGSIAPADVAALDRLLSDTELGQQIVAFKIWNAEGRVLYSKQAATIGQVFPIEGGLERALNGYVAAQLTDLSKAENVLERELDVPLLEVYSPVRWRGSDRILAVAEFYPNATELVQETTLAQQRSWPIVAGATLIMYLLIVGFVRQASRTIQRQQVVLSDQVGQLRELLNQNNDLSDRVRRAAARTTALNERVLRRISAELHDGPVQDLGLALLRLEHIEASGADLDVVKQATTHALQEVRAISTGLGLPQLNALTVSETIGRVIRTHERRTSTRVDATLDHVPDHAPVPVKITVYRVIQEALRNAFRHAGGAAHSVRVTVSGSADFISVTVADRGPGFDQARSLDGEHLGLVGMRERVESLGGTFEIDSAPGRGTTITARIPLRGEETLQP